MRWWLCSSRMIVSSSGIQDWMDDDDDAACSAVFVGGETWFSSALCQRLLFLENRPGWVE